ncbi:DotU family type IV/VI secretion system protein [Paraburkholderia solisilvae]|nr:DotU family type IV/VI secretion system protein [Paraburkholderia solisilvae]
MRSLLRDTALHVTLIATGGTALEFDKLRQSCEQLIDDFAAALHHLGYPEDVREDAQVAQCGLLDETALRHLSGDHRSRWDAQPLQIERTGRHDAGERVFERLEFRMREASPNVDLLECYASILALGFVGRYASAQPNSSGTRGEPRRTALIARLNTQLESLRPEQYQAFVIDRPDRRSTDWLYRLSPWAVAGLAGVAAVIVWLAWDATLDAKLAHLVAQAVRP